MRLTYYFLLFNFLFVRAYAQVTTPPASPRGKISQQLGLTQVEVDYSRPSARGRDIMGGLVRYGDIWRTGANKNTTVSFSDAVDVAGKPLAAGKYALYTRPSADQWEVYFYKKNNMGNASSNWEADQVALAVVVQPVYFEPMVETFTISFSDLKSNGGTLNLIWEHTLVPISLKVPTETKALESIEKTLSDEPKAGDYYQAAVYYLEENKDLKKAQGWMEKALDMREKPAYWMYRQYALILAKRNDKKAALKAVKTSLELAEKAGNKDYVIMNKASIAEWSN
jgi:tetratricopeptide (TPR) repeat protein